MPCRSASCAMSASATSGRPSVRCAKSLANWYARRGRSLVVAGEEIAEMLCGREPHLVVRQAERSAPTHAGRVERQPRRQVLPAVDEPQHRIEARLAVGASRCRRPWARSDARPAKCVRPRRRTGARWRRDDRAGAPGATRNRSPARSAPRAAPATLRITPTRLSRLIGITPSASFSSKSFVASSTAAGSFG